MGAERQHLLCSIHFNPLRSSNVQTRQIGPDALDGMALVSRSEKRRCHGRSLRLFEVRPQALSPESNPQQCGKHAANALRSISTRFFLGLSVCIPFHIVSAPISSDSGPRPTLTNEEQACKKWFKCTTSHSASASGHALALRLSFEYFKRRANHFGGLASFND